MINTQTETLERRIKLATIDHELVSRQIGDAIVEKILSVGSTGGVIGLSGGVDSTLTAILAKKAFDRYNLTHEDKLELKGYMLPSSTNSPKDAEDGIYVAEKLGIKYEVLSIQPIVEAFKYTNQECFDDTNNKSKYHRGNLASRIRANVLNTKAATENKSVIGTGNKDEDYGVGYFTLFGDGAVHMNPIGNLSKRLVRELARYHGFTTLADREPTAGLEVGQTDFKDLGYGYDAVELVIEGIDQGFSKEELIKHSQVTTLVKAQITKYENNFGTKKFADVKSVVEDIFHRHYNVALPKSRMLHPSVPEITLVYK